MRCMDSSTVALMLRSLKVSDAAVRTPMPSTPAATAAPSPFAFGTSPNRFNPSRRSTPASTSAPSAIWGTALGLTKDTASKLRSPASARSLIRPDLAASGHECAQRLETVTRG